MRAVRSAAATLIVLCSVFAMANECVAPQPPKISGPLCGRLIDATGAAVPKVDLEVLGDFGRVIASVQADSKGDFIFPNLARSVYQLKAISGGWLIEFGNFEVRKSGATCTHPVTVRLDQSCCCFGSGISKTRPPGY